MANIGGFDSPAALAAAIARGEAVAPGILPPGEGPIRIPNPPPTAPIVTSGLAVWPDGLDPNIPANAAELFSRGWRFEAGRWVKIAPGSLGTLANPDGMVGGARPSLSSVASVTAIGGGSVLGISVPQAAPVLLPAWVGGRIGVVRQSGGLRPESGGTPRVVRHVQQHAWTRVVKGAGQ